MTVRGGERQQRAWSAYGCALLCALGACKEDVAVHLLPRPVCGDAEPCTSRATALSFEGPYDRVEIPSSPLLDLPQDFAVEAWVYVRSYEGGHGILNRWINEVGDIDLTVGIPEPVPGPKVPSLQLVPSHVLACWAFVHENRWLSAIAPSLPNTQSWHHLAASYGSGSFRLYVDGKLAASVAGTLPVINPESAWFIGATARNQRAFDAGAGTLYWPPIDGFIAEVRLSSQNRYPAEFLPEPELSVDAGTIALWHLNEADGGLARDSGPSHLDGQITGASWAPAPLRGASSQ